jgi:hypothetical protein
MAGRSLTSNRLSAVIEKLQSGRQYSFIRQDAAAGWLKAPRREVGSH